MTNMTIDLAPAGTPAGLLDELYRREPLFTAAGIFMLMLMVPTGLAWLLDDRTFQGVNVWLKPLKFELSIFVYLLSLAFFVKWLPEGTRRKRWYRVYAVAVVAGLIAEMGWIGFASSNGVASHYNETSLAWTVAMTMAGVTAVMFTLAAPVYGYQIWRNPDTGLPPAMKAAIVDGLVLTGVLTIVTAGYLGSNGSHFVGDGQTDAGGMPFFGWSRDGGDLRVAHFFATHALQVIPVFGWAATRAGGGQRVLPVRLFALVYTALVAFAFVQALMGQPFLPFIR